MNIYHKIKSRLIYREAVRKADKAHAADGKRYYVMPAADGKLLIMDRENFRILKRKHYIHGKATVQDMVNECFYHTPYRNGDLALDPFAVEFKRQQYLAWYQATRKKKKQK